MIGHITSIKDEARDVRWFGIRIAEPFSHIPGQYVMLSFPGDSEKRAYSIVDHDREKGEILLVIKKAGYVSGRLFSSAIGQELELSGPYGRFTLPEQETPLVFIAGGVGITPLYCMLLHIHRTAYGKGLSLYYSAKGRDTMALYDSLAKIEDSRIRMNFVFTSESGRLTASAIRQDVEGFDGCTFYICGTAGFNESFRRELNGLQISDERIRSEDFDR